VLVSSRARPFLVLASLALSAAVLAQDVPRFILHTERLHGIDRRLFGQFMERASWHGEIGIEAAMDRKTGWLQQGVPELLRGLHMPIIRFPGGTDVDYTDWTHLIDNVPGRIGPRPVTIGHLGGRTTNYFGLHEFLRLCRYLESDPMLVVNFREGLLEEKPLREAALHAAALVAYCNATGAQKLPAGLNVWPTLRAKNGQKQPFEVHYFQVGNETWAFEDELKKQFGEQADRRYMDALKAYVDAMRDVDPTIQILVDGHSRRRNRMIREELGDKVAFLVDHYYAPWGLHQFRKRGEIVPLDQISREDLWHAWVAVTAHDEQGQSEISLPVIATADEHGYPVAMTEWNWNGWWRTESVPNPPFDSHLARGLGSAGMLHAIMRNGHTVKIANQSMTVGRNWLISAIMVDQAGERPPYYMPQGQILGFYSRLHGRDRLQLDAERVPWYEQPLEFNQVRASRKVSYLDFVATAGPDNVYIHVINRAFERDIPIQIDISRWPQLDMSATHHVFTGRVENAPRQGEPLGVAWTEEREVRSDGKVMSVVLPARSVSIIEFTRRRDGGG
jgi:alpha-L-arabinofuranosidase